MRELEDNSELGSDMQVMLDVLSSDGWDVEIDASAVAFTWQNAAARLRIIREYGAQNIIYEFAEGDFHSFVKIDYGGRLPELLHMISADRTTLSSGNYGHHLHRIVHAFPNIYYHNGSRFVLLVNPDVV